jgi:hypothetical protein
VSVCPPRAASAGAAGVFGDERAGRAERRKHARGSLPLARSRIAASRPREAKKAFFHTNGFAQIGESRLLRRRARLPRVALSSGSELRKGASAVGATIGICAGLGLMALALAFALALARSGSCADAASEQLLAECSRESAQALAALMSAPIEARRGQQSEVAERLSHRRTWRQPSSA